MTAIRVIFDGKAFIPQQSVSLPDQAEAVVLVDQGGPQAHTAVATAIRAYYENGADADDDAWVTATSPDSRLAWDAE